MTKITDQRIAEQIKISYEPWFKTYWRPAMGWLYMVICAFDFVFFPMASMTILLDHKGVAYTAWEPLTTQNGGMIHLAFGAILGITAYTRGAYEKRS